MRHLQSRFLLVVAAGAALLAAGCVISRNSLSSPDDATVDASLCGVWEKSGAKPGVDMMVIGVPNAGKVPKGMMVLHEVTLDANRNVNVAQPLLFFVSKIDATEYWNLIMNPVIDKDAPDNYLAKFEFDNWVKHPKRSYMFVRCKREKERFTIQTLDTDALAKVVMAGKLKGEIERDPQNKNITGVNLTDSTENLRVFLKSADEKLWEDNGDEYRKLR